MARLLIEKGADVKALDKDGKTPLDYAALFIALPEPKNKTQRPDDDFALLKILLDAGGALQEDKLPGNYVFNVGVVRNPAIVAYLNAYAKQNPNSPQADLEKQQADLAKKQEELAKQQAAASAFRSRAFPKAPALHKAIAEGDIKRVEKLLAGGWFSGPSDINEQHDVGSPLFFAVYYGNQPMVEFLLSRGADPNCRMPGTGESLEDFARSMGHYEIADYLAPTRPPQKGRTRDVASVSFSCPSCRARLRAKPEQAGRRVKCPKCGQRAEVPSRTND